MAADPETGKAVVTAFGLVVATWITSQWTKRWQERKAQEEAREHYSVAQIQAETADVAGLRQFVVDMVGKMDRLGDEIDECRKSHAECERRCTRVEAVNETLLYKNERMQNELTELRREVKRVERVVELPPTGQE